MAIDYYLDFFDKSGEKISINIFWATMAKFYTDIMKELGITNKSEDPYFVTITQDIPLNKALDFIGHSLEEAKEKHDFFKHMLEVERTEKNEDPYCRSEYLNFYEKLKNGDTTDVVNVSLFEGA